FRGAAACCFAAALLAAAVHPAEAAPPPGVVSGIARDALQRPLAGATLRLEAPDGSVVARATAGEDGSFHFAGIAPGIYSAIAEKDAFDTASALVTLDGNAGADAVLTLASKTALDLALTAQRLDAARKGIEPRIGASTYTIPEQAIQNQPGGENNALNQ